MFERVKQDWDKIIYIAIGFFVLFYVSFYFSTFAVEPPKQNTRQIIVTEYFDGETTVGSVDPIVTGSGDVDPSIDESTIHKPNEMDRTVEEILDEIHSDADMCKKLSSNVQRDIYCNQLDESTCGVKECCVSLYKKDNEFGNCSVGDQMGPTYAQPKTMKYFSFDGENKEKL